MQVIPVVICFLFSIFDVLETTIKEPKYISFWLWFAFFLVSLTYWKQPNVAVTMWKLVVICFLFSIFDVLETTFMGEIISPARLWFAFFLVSLTYWKQRCFKFCFSCSVVICFLFSIFDVLETTFASRGQNYAMLWFAFFLVSLTYWKQHHYRFVAVVTRCDLLSF